MVVAEDAAETPQALRGQSHADDLAGAVAGDDVAHVREGAAKRSNEPDEGVILGFREGVLMEVPALNVACDRRR